MKKFQFFIANLNSHSHTCVHEYFLCCMQFLPFLFSIPHHAICAYLLFSSVFFIVYYLFVLLSHADTCDINFHALTTLLFICMYISMQTIQYIFVMEKMWQLFVLIFALHCLLSFLHTC